MNKNILTNYGKKIKNLGTGEFKNSLIPQYYNRLIRLTAVDASGHQGFWGSKIDKIIFDIKSLPHNKTKFQISM